MLAWQLWSVDRPGPVAAAQTSLDFPAARLAVEVQGDSRLYCGWSRGAAFKLFEGDALVASDTGPTLRTRSGRIAVTHLDGAVLAERTPRRLRVEGRMAWADATLLDPVRSIALRLLMQLLGRFRPDRVRALLQRRLVTGRRDAPYRFERLIEWREGGWIVQDRIIPDRDWRDVAQIGVSGFQTSTATVMSRVWQEDQLQPWQDWTPLLATCGHDAPLEVERSYPAVQERRCAAC